MTLSKITVPDSVVLSHNVIPVTLETDKYRTTLGTKQVLKLVCTTNTTAGKKLTVGWKEFDMELVFATTPDDTGMQLPLYDKAVSTGFDSLLAAFKTNYYLDRYYVIALVVTGSTGNYVGTFTFTQRTFGQSWAAATFTGDDPTKYAPTIDVAQVMPVYGANFRFLCDLFYQSNPAAARSYANIIAQIDASGNDENIGKFNLSEIFKKWAVLKPNFPSDTTFQECPDVIKNYYLVFAESYGATEQAKNNITEPATLGAGLYNQVILGGLPYLEHPVSTFLADHIDATYNKFLTRHTSGKTVVNKAMPHWLSWYQKAAVTDLKVKVTLYMSDGTSTTVTKTTTTGSFSGKKIYQVAVGYDQLSLDLDLTALLEPVKYEVWIEDGASTRLTEKFVFAVDLRYNQYNNYLFYHNSLGGIDTEWFTGTVLKTPEISGNELVLATQNDYTDGNIEIRNSKTRYSYEFNTGFKQNKNEIEHLIEMLQSNHVRWLPDPKNRAGFTDPLNLMKVVIDKGSVKEWVNDTDSIYALSFTVMEGHYEW